MKKFLFYSLWRAEKLEERLRRFEAEGWPVHHVTCSCFFEFVKTKPKDTAYILLYDMPRDRTAGMYEYEHKLLSECAANAISTRFTGYDLFRITGENRRFDELKTYRKKYFIPSCTCVFLTFALFAYTVYGYCRQVINCRIAS